MNKSSPTAGRLDGKVALITGGCSGMGLATARLFLSEGASVVIADVQEQKGRALEAELGSALASVRCDVTLESEIAAAVTFAQTRFGGLDIVFNNAGAVGDPAGIETITAEGWDNTLALLLRSTMLGIKHAIPALRERGGGSIINTASLAALQAGRSTLAYSVAKAGIVHLTRMAAGELAPDNIRVNTICPGLIVTPLFGQLVDGGAAVAEDMQSHLRDTFGRLQPLHRAGLPHDIAEACLFLASSASNFITGTEIIVDGGLMVEQKQVADPQTGRGFMELLADARNATASLY